MAADDLYDGRAFYVCLSCDCGIEVQYPGIVDPKAFALTIQRYANGCPRCHSLNTRLQGFIAQPVTAP
jgi:hypothetical protein